ncbi:hypothetical protein [Pseudopontixanthobacter vadosimaris]|nr:hypothetical protein [Pseudopontixanthobacter vadosimaris]
MTQGRGSSDRRAPEVFSRRAEPMLRQAEVAVERICAYGIGHAFQDR